MSIYSSIYIPRMSLDHTEESIRNIMEFYRIGTIIQVDFTPINKKPGFGENVDQVVKSAFVHFSDPWFCTDKFYHFQSRTFMGNTNFWETIAIGQPYKIQVNPTEYWMCLKNKNPVQRTMMNIHQVVENGRHLEGRIEAQAKTIQEQAEKIQALERKLVATEQVVSQLITGLFNDKDQSGVLQLHMDVLTETPPNHNFKDSSKWGLWPTTHQGNDCERKIAELEEKLTCLENDLTDYGVL